MGVTRADMVSSASVQMRRASAISLSCQASRSASDVAVSVGLLFDAGDDAARAALAGSGAAAGSGTLFRSGRPVGWLTDWISDWISDWAAARGAATTITK